MDITRVEATDGSAGVDIGTVLLLLKFVRLSTSVPWGPDLKPRPSAVRFSNNKLPDLREPIKLHHVYQTKPITPAASKKKGGGKTETAVYLVFHNIAAITGSVDRPARLQLAKDLFRQLSLKRQLTSPNL
jgi:hypothetical protein